MKPTVFLILAASFLFSGISCIAASPEALKREITASPGKSGGIYFAYPFNSDSIPSVPAGYEPVAISHYGRHGSRWAINERQYPLVADFMREQRKKGNLTAEGERVLAMVDSIAGHAAGHAGELSPLGQLQHKGIARRMMARTPRLFADSAQVIARSSVEPRCIVSMAAFSEALKEGNPALRVSRSATPGDMAFISFSTPEAKAFSRESAPWRESLQAFRDSLVNYDAVLGRLFVDLPDSDSIPAKEYLAMKGKFVKTLHDIAVTTQNVGLDIDLLSFFTPDELYGLWQAINYNMYVCHANAPASDSVGMKCAASLLRNIVEDADASLEGRKAAVQLRFGHDTALIRLLAMMGIDGCAESEADPARYAEAWRDFRISPMGANLQMIFYRRPDDTDPDNALVLILHNERPATLPVLSASKPFYPWSALKSFWQPYLMDRPKAQSSL